MCSSIMYQNIVPEFNSDLLLSRRWQVSIDFLIFSTTNSRVIVQTPPFLVSWPQVYYLPPIRVSFVKLSLKQYTDLRDSSLLKLWCEKRINLEKMQGQSCFILKNVGCFFCADEDPQTDPFFGYSMYIPDINFLGSSATIIFYHKKVIVMGNLSVQIHEIAR